MGCVMAEQESGSKKFIEFGPQQWLGLVLVIVAIVFIAQNRGAVTVWLLWTSVSAPMWLVLTIVTLIGLAAGYLFGRRNRRRR